jgi:hypothetical protein
MLVSYGPAGGGESDLFCVRARCVCGGGVVGAAHRQPLLAAGWRLLDRLVHASPLRACATLRPAGPPAPQVQARRPQGPVEGPNRAQLRKPEARERPCPGHVRRR